MVDIYAVEASKDGNILHIWIPADKIPPVLSIEEQLTSQEIVVTRKVTVTYFGVDYSDADIPALLQHLEKTYSYTLSQITDIILWCGERIPQSKCLELLKKART